MKLKKILLLIIIITVFVSCNKNKPTTETDTETPEINQNQFVIDNDENVSHNLFNFISVFNLTHPHWNYNNLTELKTNKELKISYKNNYYSIKK